MTAHQAAQIENVTADPSARSGRRRSTARKGMVVAGASAVFLTALTVGGPAQAVPYCRPGASGSFCGSESQRPAAGKTVIARADVNFGRSAGTGAYDNPNWQQGWNACRSRDSRTRSISWVYREWLNGGGGKVTWACYLQQ